ncbi:MAG: prepilin-type N-terminal cleavage/methylation domain-containing protein [Candidatus Pacebacteria bacterium]|nr:prepilin-type N-terminal cleavage/methylation domain-containing protein [Candidatus Paceibacterota bacterium]
MKKRLGNKFRKEINFIRSQSSFSLVEMLIVLGLLAILAAVAVFVLRPDQALKQARDSKRLTDVQTINQAVSLYGSFGGSSTGSANTVYVSLPDDASTTCASHAALPILPTGWAYSCKTALNYRNIDGTGWVPVDLSTASTYGVKIASLPVDPTNTASGGLYYTYVTGGSWEITAKLESEEKHDAAINDGGMLPGVYQVGTHTDLTPPLRDLGLVGYWNFEEGAGGSAYDSSGNGNNGTWAGTGSHYASGKVDTYAGQFNGSDDYVQALDSNTLDLAGSAMTLSAWVYIDTNVGHHNDIIHKYNYQTGGYLLITESSAEGGQGYGRIDNGSTTSNLQSTPAISLGTWNHLLTVYDGKTYLFYVNGISAGANNSPVSSIKATALNFRIGAYVSGFYSGFFDGLIDDVRVYNRALSLDEIRAIYNATK